MRRLNALDQLIGAADDMLKTFAGGTPTPQRPSPAQEMASELELSDQERKHIAGLMRVNHCGEVCAQALYRGQALGARNANVRENMRQSALEEEDHLAWCEQRLEQLDSQPSYLNPLWYGLSFSIGALAGAAGDRVSLGFVAATEEQVCAHLKDHYAQLPKHDEKSRSILEQMIEDEGRHAEHALDEGGLRFPGVVKNGMSLMSKLMTATTYRV